MGIGAPVVFGLLALVCWAFVKAWGLVERAYDRSLLFRVAFVVGVVSIGIWAFMVAAHVK